MIQSSLTSLSTSPFFSSIITLYTIVLLYFPTFFIQIIFSPVFLFTFILLLYLLRLGASQRSASKFQQGKEQDSDSTKPISEYFCPKGNVVAELDSAQLIQQDLGSAESIFVYFKSAEPLTNELNSANLIDEYLGSAEPIHEDMVSTEPNSDNFKSSDLKFVEWHVRAPLEVIYESNEGEQEGQNNDVRDTQMAIIERYASLSMYYPETDSDNSSSEMDFPVTGESSSPENVGFRWDEEEVEGLIEIELDAKMMMKNEVEEDNLIEIDLSPAR
ncbi:hypothetical protein Leryth_026728 [Lithospermum erythrorhizon]|uniref:Uncharacterized protein n=1 Tax=Lithospermum erythrorhizon TaxID=34254 RepID=A0AAV3P2D5_LITER|nr:hypothetical protein Leryth_026728 [Lithospermum erythrorhizon]